MTTIASRCLSFFQPSVRDRGQAYYRGDRIDLDYVDEDEGSVVATVLGSTAYDVSVEWDRTGKLTVACSCPYAQGVPCKHIWGTLLAIDAGGHGSSLRGLAVLRPQLVVLDSYEDLIDHRSFDLAPHTPIPRDVLEPWQTWLRSMGTIASKVPLPPRARRREIYLTIHPEEHDALGMQVSFKVREQRMNGSWGKVKRLGIHRDDLREFTPGERRLLQPLLDLNREPIHNPYGWYRRPSRIDGVNLPFSLLGAVLPSLCASGRFGWWIDETRNDAFRPLAWDGDRPYHVVLVGAMAGEGDLELSCRLERPEPDGDSFPIQQSLFFVSLGLCFLADRIVRFEAAEESFPWLASLHRQQIRLPARAANEALAQLLPMSGLPEVRLPEGSGWDTEPGTPIPVLSLQPPGAAGEIRAEVLFVYNGEAVRPGDLRAQVADEESRTLLLRDRQAEERWLDSLGDTARELSVVTSTDGEGEELLLTPEGLPPVVEKLLEAGWHVRSEGRAVRTSRGFELSVTSGIDWFDVAGSMDFGGAPMALPRLLAAARDGARFVRLDDGTLGMLPEDWLRRFAGFAGIAGSAADQGESVRFHAHQALVLDALLASEPKLRVDEVFAAVREKLRTFDRLESRTVSSGFEGELREYQEVGLAWQELLADLRLGGCLADDMGLGKTVQVLAHLWGRKTSGAAENLPSLLVVPRSLIYNWASEAARFTPGLSVVSYHGPQRKDLRARLGDHDLVVTTYGTLRRDIGFLRECEFDLAVLDEAQAIKNPKSQTAKASRLLKARHRLALTGTPVENHLGELWSIFEYLNPSLLGQLPALSEHVGKNSLPPEALDTVARALRPLILRRTKSEVLKDLPVKTEQTLYCDLSAKERREYDKLLDYYRSKLLSKVRTSGLGRSKIMVLEALLRLRQMACHPALLDAERHGENSAKLEVLVEQVEQVAGEGHKVLVFSQFTKLLALVKTHFEARGIPYEYLDGRTRDRQERVERFQADPDCRAFLISLKAGGLGLNLTAAEYVFLLDPWWNPAVESQAIDRAHRIGQENPVFAYRLIARDTIEEKILKMQEDKKALADAVVARDGRLLKQLTVEDLELLLG